MPTILIAYANDSSNRLDSLAEEAKAIQRMFRENVQYHVEILPDVRTRDLVKDLKADKQIEIIHYAGHANNDSLYFADIEADAIALADKIRGLSSVKLVFINGCSSAGQVKAFHEAGVPFVIATSRAVEDSNAFWFANLFYNYLCSGFDLRKAFDECFKDNNLEKRRIPFAAQRGISGSHEEVNEEQPFAWGLYIKEGAENDNFSLPCLKQRKEQIKINHTDLLDEFLYALEGFEGQQFTEIKRLVQNLEMGNIADNKKIAELLKALPYPLGIRLRKITIEPDELTNEYYEELVNDTVYLFETMLHYSSALMLTHIWQNKKEHSIDNTISGFWKNNRVMASPFLYKNHFQDICTWLKAHDVSNCFSTNEENNILNYLQSENFIKACDFFYWHKQAYSQKLRLSNREYSRSYYIAQKHLIAAFKVFAPLAAYFMVSVRGINVINCRYVPTEYGNAVSKLILNESQPNVHWNAHTLENKLVLCYRSNNNNVNEIFNQNQVLCLFPFVIDRNVFAEKPNTEVDLYLYMGYFPNKNNVSTYHFISIQNTDKVWEFDDKQRKADFLHQDDPDDEIHRQNHLMANVGEFKMYLNKFKHNILNL